LLDEEHEATNQRSAVTSTAPKPQEMSAITLAKEIFND